MPVFKYSMNENFFSEETEKSFYWAGFLAADGHIDDKRATPRIRLSLKHSDGKHVETFARDIEYTGVVHEYDYAHKMCGRDHSSRIAISSVRAVKDLEKFGVVPRKTSIMKFPDWVISHDFVNHYIRGYFDGDGSICQSKRENGLIYFSSCIAGTLHFLETILKVFNEHGLCTKTKPTPRGNIHTIGIGGSRKLLLMRDFLYRDATRFLQRKRDLFFSEDLKYHEPIINDALKIARVESGIRKRKPIIATSIETGENIYMTHMNAMPDRFIREAIKNVCSGKAKSHRDYLFRKATQEEIERHMEST